MSGKLARLAGLWGGVDHFKAANLWYEHKGVERRRDSDKLA